MKTNIIKKYYLHPSQSLQDELMFKTGPVFNILQDHIYYNKYHIKVDNGYYTFDKIGTKYNHIEKFSSQKLRKFYFYWNKNRFYEPLY